jgi:glucose-6-phosphate 1-dehydrogenase
LHQEKEGWRRIVVEKPLSRYEPGTWGPEEAQAFLAEDNRAWLHLCVASNDA